MLHRHATPAVAGSYTAGALAGASLSSGVLLVLSGLVSPIPASARAVVAIGLLVLLALHGLGVLCLDLPQRTQQIPRETFNDSPTRAAFRFAAELGTGVRTYVTKPAPYGLAVIMLLCVGDSLSTAVVGAVLAALGFGLGRARIVVAQAFRRTVAVDHPALWLTLSNHVSLVLALVVAITFAIGA